jgi:hypothetical protein
MQTADRVAGQRGGDFSISFILKPRRRRVANYPFVSSRGLPRYKFSFFSSYGRWSSRLMADS